ncbi:MAG: helix-turn-helix domain-containing protein [Myxococcota bacterium]|nr:helix-turn-helix domain-containing protein [Myxococcota bacterium]
MTELNDLRQSAGDADKLISPKQAAKMLGVSESSMKRWCDKGLLEIHRTAGGHRRIPVSSLLAFVRQGGHQIFYPEEIGLPAGVTHSATTAHNDALDLLCRALSNGQEETARQIILSTWLGGTPLSEILDLYVAPVFMEIGCAWEHQDIEVYQERRAVVMAERILNELRNLLSPPRDDAPIALGGTLEEDPYSLGTAMCELTLRGCGWRAQNLGPWQPATTFVSAIETHRPRIFWLSVSSIVNKEKFFDSINQIADTAEKYGTALILGGRAIKDEQERRPLKFTAFCESMTRLESLANQLIAPSHLPT